MFALHLFTEVSANPTYSLDFCFFVVFFKSHLIYIYIKNSHEDNIWSRSSYLTYSQTAHFLTLSWRTDASRAYLPWGYSFLVDLNVAQPGFETAGKQSCPSIKQCRLVLLNVLSGQRWRGGLFLRGCGIYWLCDNIHLVWWRITLFGLRRPWSTGAASGSGSRGQQRSRVTTLTYIPLHSCRGLRVK